jgi:tRNA (guanine-N7-)-methyltransferase
VLYFCALSTGNGDFFHKLRENFLFMARRKEMKKAAYRELPNCFAQPDELAGKWHTVFGNQHPITLELGCGKAAFSYEMARRHPDRNFIGIDLKMDRMWKPATRAVDEGIKNLAFLFSHLMQLPNKVGLGEADEIWITFPDPYPKKKQAKRRMLNPEFLRQYQQVLRPGGRIHYKTDNLELFHYSLEVFVREGDIRLHELTFDLHQESHIPDDVKIMTDYERKFVEMGKTINYVCMSF